MDAQTLKTLVATTLDDMKAKDVECLDVRGQSSFADYMFVATGTSSRHVKSLADELALRVKEAGHPARGVEGQDQAEWILIDLGDIVVHVMQAATRKLYDLESLWGLGDSRPA